MRSNRISVLACVVAAFFAAGAIVDSAVATTTPTTTAKPATTKKKVVVHKPAPRPAAPDPVAVVKPPVAASSPIAVPIGTPTASRKALSVPSSATAAPQPQRKAVTFARPVAPGATHTPGRVAAHVAQNDVHFELKP